MRLLQIWILPERAGLAPSYEQRAFASDETRNRLRLVASPDARDGSLTVHQDVTLWRGELAQGTRLEHGLAPGRHAWLQVARGRVRLGTQALEAGDGAALAGERAIELEALADGTDLLLFDLA